MSADDLVTAEEAAEIVGYASRGVWYYAVRNGQAPPPVVTSRPRRWLRSEVESFARARQAPPPPTTPPPTVPSLFTDEGEHFLLTHRAAALLGITPRYLLRLAQEGQIAAPVREGRRYWWHPDAIRDAGLRFGPRDDLIGPVRAAEMVGLTRQGWLYRVANDPQAPQPIQERPRRWLAREVRAYAERHA